jgi:hypothetical protein
MYRVLLKIFLCNEKVCSTSTLVIDAYLKLFKKIYLN